MGWYIMLMGNALRILETLQTGSNRSQVSNEVSPSSAWLTWNLLSADEWLYVIIIGYGIRGY